MNKRGAFWFFLLATVSSAALFLYLTYDTHKQVDVLSHVDKLTDDVVAGKRVWEKYNCNDCHTILGFGGYYAPDVTKVYNRLGEEGIKYRVKHPEQAFAASPRKMPNQNLSDEEASRLVAFLKWIGEIDNNDWPPQDSSKKISKSALKLTAGVGMNLGPALFKEKGCINCHRLAGVGSKYGPAVDKVGGKYDENTLERLIRNPRSVDPSATMPPQDRLSDAELDTIAHFLATLK